MSAGLTCPNCASPVSAGAWFCGNCGSDVLDHAAKASAEPAATAESTEVPSADSEVAETAPTLAARLRARTGRLLRRVGYRKLIAAVVVIAALVAADRYFVQSRNADGPEPVVRALFSALGQLDEATASALGVCANSPVCTQDGLNDGYEPPEDLQITGVEYGEPKSGDLTRRPDKSRAAVHVSYRIGQETYQDTFFLSQGIDVQHTWKFDNPVGRHVLVRSQFAVYANVAGAKVQLASAQKDGEGAVRALWLVPGIYDIAGASSVLFDTTPVRLTVAGRDTCVPLPDSSAIRSHMTKSLDGRSSVQILNNCDGLETTVNVTLKTGLMDTVNRQVKDYLDGCAAQSVFKPRTQLRKTTYACPFFEDNYAQKAGVMRNLTWSITKYPDLTLSTTGERVAASTITPGAATVSFDWSNDFFAANKPSAKWERITEEVKITVEGQVTVGEADPSSILWAPR